MPAPAITPDRTSTVATKEARPATRARQRFSRCRQALHASALNNTLLRCTVVHVTVRPEEARPTDANPRLWNGTDAGARGVGCETVDAGGRTTPTGTVQARRGHVRERARALAARVNTEQYHRLPYTPKTINGSSTSNKSVQTFAPMNSPATETTPTWCTDEFTGR